MATIKGKWVFKEAAPTKVTLPEQDNSTDINYEYVNFTTPAKPNIQFFGMGYRADTDSMSYVYKTDVYPIATWTAYNYSTGNWNGYDWRVVDFGTIEQEVSNTFGAWITYNAVADGGSISGLPPVLPTDTVGIVYNGTTIASLKAGQSATLPCKDKPMHTDVVVSVPDGMGAGEVVEEWDGSIEVV